MVVNGVQGRQNNPTLVKLRQLDQTNHGQEIHTGQGYADQPPLEAIKIARWRLMRLAHPMGKAGPQIDRRRHGQNDRQQKQPRGQLPSPIEINRLDQMPRAKSQQYCQTGHRRKQYPKIEFPQSDLHGLPVSDERPPMVICRACPAGDGRPAMGRVSKHRSGFDGLIGIALGAEELDDAFEKNPGGDGDDDRIDRFQQQVVGVVELQLVQYGRPEGHHRHEDGGDAGHQPFHPALGFEIDGDDNQGQGRQRLVDRPEKRPKFERALSAGTRGESQDHRAAHGNGGGRVFSREKIKFEADEQFTENITLNTRGRVQGGAGKGGHENRHDRQGELLGNSQGVNHVGRPIHKGRNLGPQAGRRRP
ncbi:hypothetical protein DESC_480201 [Desulfosarcina cetonica]|nr:hypothetical protein DESC_480201 [Desulfosarcina cetonica]